MPSFDVVSKLQMQEVDNAVVQAQKELGTRYDFRGTNTSVELTPEGIMLHGPDDEHLKAALESRGARVNYVECYRRMRPATDPAEARSAIERGDVHAVHAMSAESVENFGAILGPAVSLDALALVVPHEAIGRSPARARFGRLIVAGPGPRGVVDALLNLRKVA